MEDGFALGVLDVVSGWRQFLSFPDSLAGWLGFLSPMRVQHPAQLVYGPRHGVLQLGRGNSAKKRRQKEIVERASE